jgi:hypothetical protein
MSRVTPSREYPRKHEGRCRPGVDRRCGCRQQQDGRLLPLREHQRWSWLISSLLRTAMSEGLPGGTLGVSSKSELEGAHAHVARRIESQSTSTGHCVLDGHGEVVGETAVPADADGLRGLADPLAGRRVRAVIESMNGARFVHDALEEHRWDVLIADAQRVKGPAPLACRTTASTPRCSPSSRGAIWCRRSGCPTRRSAASVSWRASGCIWFVTARRWRTAW